MTVENKISRCDKKINVSSKWLFFPYDATEQFLLIKSSYEFYCLKTLKIYFRLKDDDMFDEIVAGALNKIYYHFQFLLS